MTCNLKTRLN